MIAIEQLYQAVGQSGIERLVAAFYRQIPDDPLLGPMYPPDDLVGAEQRLRDFLLFRFGGPTTYIEQRGHPRLRLRHAGFAIDQAARDRWVELMGRALEEAQLPPEAAAAMKQFFEQTASFLQNR